jgi:hypothetical protein
LASSFCSRSLIGCCSFTWWATTIEANSATARTALSSSPDENVELLASNVTPTSVPENVVLKASNTFPHLYLQLFGSGPV